MKIALLVGRFGSGSGTGGVALRLSLALQRSGHEVAVWCAKIDARPEGIALYPLGERQTAASRVPAGWLRLGLDRVPGCEVVRASGGVHEAWLSARGGPRTSFVRPFLALGLGGLLDRELALDRAAALGARVIICNSLRTAGEVMAYHGIPAERVRVIPNGVDLLTHRPDAELRARARARWQIPEGGRVALFAGHGFRRKGLQTAIEAFRLAARPDDRLVLAGHDAHASRWIRAARRTLAERVLVTGALAPLQDWLVGADVLLLPSRYDSASNTALEAMACGVPPVLSASDGSAELLPDRRLAVADPSDAQGFASAVRYAWGSAGLGARCAAAAARWPETRMATSIEHLLMEFANG